MARRRAGAISSSERRHTRTMLRLAEAAEKFKDRVYAECWICGYEFVLTAKKSDVRDHSLGGHLICPSCRVVINGKAFSRGKLDWARRFVQMHMLITKVSDMPCYRPTHPEGVPDCKCTTCTARRLIESINSERTTRRLYRKVRQADEA